MKPAMTAGMSYSVVILLALVACVNARSFYEVLGVDRNATPRQLKKGYMNQVLKYHPDKNDSPDATDKFMEVTTAYECLGDPELRKKYDSIGHDAYVGSNQSDKKTQGKHEQQGDPFSKFESFFRSEQRSSSFDDDDEFFQNFFSEFDGMFESHGFGDGGPGFRSSKTFRRSGGGGIKIEVHEHHPFFGRHSSYGTRRPHSFMSLLTNPNDILFESDLDVLLTFGVVVLPLLIWFLLPVILILRHGISLLKLIVLAILYFVWTHQPISVMSLLANQKELLLEGDLHVFIATVVIVLLLLFWFILPFISMLKQGISIRKLIIFAVFAYFFLWN